MKVSRDCWKCEYPECGHIWIATGEDPPEQCAKCKKRKWHTDGLIEVSAPQRKTVTARKKSNGKLSPRDEKRMTELNDRFEEHIQDEMEKPTRLARVMAAVPEVRPAVDIVSPVYEKPSHAPNCSCYSCRPPREK